MEKPHCKILPYTSETMKLAVEYIHSGKLVSFPTETVYGLGANALNKEATTLIFTTKERPMNDPLIAHVENIESALKLIDINKETESIFVHLAKTYWPGPLTLVVKANDKVVPPTVTAGTGCVGIRCPNNPIALDLIHKSGLPIAAPSANKFGHVSPTKPEHVAKDFANNDVLIIEGGSCSFGIESTVAKLTESNLLILRKGGVSEESLRKTLSCSEFHVVVSCKEQTHTKDETAPMEAPGMLLRHYAPALETCIIDSSIKLCDWPTPLSECALLDFAATHSDCKDKVKWYRDLSPSGNFKEAIANIYEFLRLSESQSASSRLLLVNLTAKSLDKSKCQFVEHLEALYDRMFRAASGKICKE